MSKINYTPPPQKPTFMQWVDKFLNVAIVIFILFAVFNYFMSSRVEQPKTIEEEAAILFDEQKNSDNKKDTQSFDDILNIKNDEINIDKEIEKNKGISFFDDREYYDYIYKSSDKPLFLFIYASWCPYCKQMIPYLSEIADNNSDKYNFVAISIDQNNSDIEDYVKEANISKNIKLYKTVSNSKRNELGKFLKKHNPNFSGGIPYTAIAWKKETIAEFAGKRSKENILNILSDLDDHVKKYK